MGIRLLLSFVSLLACARFVIVAEVPVREFYATAPYQIEKGMIATDSLPRHFSDCRYHLRIDIPPRCRHASWNVRLDYDDDTFSVITLSRTGAAAEEHDYGLPLDVVFSSYSSDSLLLKQTKEEIVRDIDPSVDGWSLTLTSFAYDENLTCAIGQKTPLLSFPVKKDNLRHISSASLTTGLRLARLSLFVSESDNLMATSVSSLAELADAINNSGDISEGYWSYLDRDTDPTSVGLGGNYRLATLRRPDGAIEIIYLSGARHNKDFWKPMMLKGLLKPTIFTNHYDLIWYDAYGSRISDETSADIIDGSIIRLNFPLLRNAQIRLRRVVSGNMETP